MHLDDITDEVLDSLVELLERLNRKYWEGGSDCMYESVQPFYWHFLEISCNLSNRSFKIRCTSLNLDLKDSQETWSIKGIGINGEFENVQNPSFLCNIWCWRFHLVLYVVWFSFSFLFSVEVMLRRFCCLQYVPCCSCCALQLAFWCCDKSYGFEKVLAMPVMGLSV